MALGLISLVVSLLAFILTVLVGGGYIDMLVETSLPPLPYSILQVISGGVLVLLGGPIARFANKG